MWLRTRSRNHKVFPKPLSLISNSHVLHLNNTLLELRMAASGGDLSWYFSQVKGTLDDDVAEGN